MADKKYDRSTQDLGNIVNLGHINVCITDQHVATHYYVTGLGLTRDPFLNAGARLMWINVGPEQFHLPTGEPDVVRGIAGLVVPDATLCSTGLPQCASSSRGRSSSSARATIASRPSVPGATASTCMRRTRVASAASFWACPISNLTCGPAPPSASHASIAR